MASINLNDFKKQNCIGKGTYSKVYKIIEKNTNEIFAAKVLFEKFDENSSEKLTTLSQEVNITAGLNHPSILRFKGFSPIDFKKRPRPVIITEYASNGTLEDHLIKDRLQS